MTEVEKISFDQWSINACKALRKELIKSCPKHSFLKKLNDIIKSKQWLYVTSYQYMPKFRWKSIKGV